MDDLFHKLFLAKRKEERARKARVEIESSIVEKLGCKEDGSETHTGEKYKVTITGKITRKLDLNEWERVKELIPETHWPVEYRPSLVTKGVKFLKEKEPEMYQKLAEALTSKPAKPSLIIKEV